MVESINELRQICQKTYSSPYNRLVTRRLSIYLTRLLLYTPITANQVTLFMTIVGLLSGLLFAYGDYWYSIIGALLYFLYHLLDHVDGEIARYRGSASLRGYYIERLSHIVVQPLIFVGISFGLYHNFNNILAFVFGYSASLFTLLLLLVRLERVKIMHEAKLEDQEKAKFLKRTKERRFMIDLSFLKSSRLKGKRIHISEFDPCGTEAIMYIILICSIINYLHIALIFYGIVLPLKFLFKARDNITHFYDL